MKIKRLIHNLLLLITGIFLFTHLVNASNFIYSGIQNFGFNIYSDETLQLSGGQIDANVSKNYFSDDMYYYVLYGNILYKYSKDKGEILHTVNVRVYTPSKMISQGDYIYISSGIQILQYSKDTLELVSTMKGVLYNFNSFFI